MTSSTSLTGEPRRGPNRRAFLAGAAGSGLIAALGMPAAANAATTSAELLKRTPNPGSTFRNSLSVSPFTESMLESGLRFTDGAGTANSLEAVQRLFLRHGSSEVFARIATRRVARDRNAQHGMKLGLVRARLAQKLRLPLNPELGLWAVYGDISHQPGPDFSDYPQIRLPKPWHELTLAQMTSAMRQYGRLAAAEILATGVDVDVWDLGNEVEFGVAGVAIRSFTESTDYWTYTAPDAVDPEIGRMTAWQLFGMPDRNQWLAQHLWPAVGAIFAAVAEGIRSVDPAAKFSTHTSTIALQLPDTAAAFYRSMAAAGFEVDELGVSYYPTSAQQQVPDQLATFKATALAMQTEFGKPVFIAETGYPSSPMGEPFAWNTPVLGYPIDTDGEYRFFRDLAAWGAETGVLSGIRQWAPDYPTAEWAPMSHFTVSGKTAISEPVIDSIADGVAQAGGLPLPL